MAETMKVPGIGPVNQKYVIAGGAVVAGIVGYAWWKRGTENAAAAEPTAVDPDLIPETERTPVVGDSTGNFPQTDPDKINTNADWTQRATEYFATFGNYEPGFVSEALGKYLSGRGLTDKEQNVVMAAIGAFGYPPVGDHPIKPALPSGGTGAGTAPVVTIPAAQLTASAGRGAVTFRWTYHGPAIGGFELTVTNLSTGEKYVNHKMIGASSRSYTARPPARSRYKHGHKLQGYIRPFRGGFSAHKNYGPGDTASATPK